MRNKKNISLSIFFAALLLILPLQMYAADESAHKNGELVSSSGTIFLIKNGQRLGFRTLEEFLSNGFRFDMAVPANKADLLLPEGAPVKARSGTLALDKSDGTTMYYIFDDGAHPVPGLNEMFFSNAEGRTYYPVSLADYVKTKAISGFDLIYLQHPAGSLININGTIYLVTSEGKAPFPSWPIFLSYGYDAKEIFTASKLDKEKLKELSSLSYRDGTLVNDNGTIYLLSGGNKFGFKTYGGFQSRGYSVSAVISGSAANYPEGQPFE